ncbi:MAG: hypothetical protein ACP5E3_16195, partial [Bacteroidales bacterium]
IRQTIERENPIVLSSKPEVSVKDISFIDINKSSLVDHQFEIHDLENQVALTLRQRPAGYIIMPGNSELVERLKILGLDLITTNSDLRLDVERYIIEKSALSETQFEGIFPNTVVTRLEKCTKSFPQGSTIVYLDQRNANLAVSVLEPEMDNGFIYYRVLDAKAGDELPYYRLTNKVR